MSIILSLLLLLGFSLHAYDARAIRALAHHSITKETDEKVLNLSARVSVESRPNEDGELSDNEAVERVGWKVVHRRKGEAEPAGFNLDYLPPKTHPPSHN